MQLRGEGVIEDSLRGRDLLFGGLGRDPDREMMEPLVGCFDEEL
jgi:hypothetical protein